ncbi:MAG TPA: SDR family NAD(P)-dependent oxidoreductase [Acidimicrobiales bacterium]|nr:SDR family NAD(P)-dependent oxidoreductase [Acidimicrobiales bacterium]
MTQDWTSQSHLSGRVVVVTGSGGGFGRLIVEMAGQRGAHVVVADIDSGAVAHEAAKDAWDCCIDVDPKGTLNGICAVYDQMVEQGRGHIVNVSSIYANSGTAGSGVSSATKAAVADIRTYAGVGP